MYEEGNNGLRVVEVGLCVNLFLFYLGVFLDCIVFDFMLNEKYGGLEIKINLKVGFMGFLIVDIVGYFFFGVNYFLVLKDG